MPPIFKWPLWRLIQMVCNILQNRFDCFIIVEGNRGLGKSTFAYKLARGVQKEMKKRGVEGYKFIPKKHLLYDRDKVINFVNEWYGSGIADEMINVSFNRDFYNEEQKDLIKLLNMNRDHCNLFIACVPQFQTLDTQIKNLCKIKITVVRRGLAIIQTPNQSIYSRDKWDQGINEKIEQGWIKKGSTKPRYSRLTTFRGYIRFNKLSEKQEGIYQAVKDIKRNEIRMKAEGKDPKKSDDPFEKIYQELLNKQVRSPQVLEGMAQAMGFQALNLKNRLRNRLMRDKKPSSLSSYYWDGKAKKEEVKNKSRGKLDQLINEIKQQAKEN